jgi:hypothetical protein
MTAHEHATTSADTHNGDSTARPKISKRPAQFSSPAARASSVTALAPLLTPEAPMSAPATAASAHKPWQDDGRFAVALLTIVLLVNLIVSYWLSQVQPATPQKNPIAAEMSITGPDDASESVTIETPNTEDKIPEFRLLEEPATPANEQ